MKKMASMILLGFMAFGLVSCKKGTISGQVLDPFTGAPVPLCTIWLEGTPQQIKSPDGSFHFQKLKEGTYKINAGKNKYSKMQDTVTVTEAQETVKKNVYIYSKADVEPGMYKANPAGADKIQTLWLNWEATCKESGLAYRLKFADPKTKKDVILPDAQKQAADIDVLFYQPGSANEAIEAKVYPMAEGKVADHKDCSNFDAKATTGLFADVSKAQDLTVSYKSDMLVTVKGTLPKGKQAVVLMQGGKAVKSYLFDVQ